MLKEVGALFEERISVVDEYPKDYSIQKKKKKKKPKNLKEADGTSLNKNHGVPTVSYQSVFPVKVVQAWFFQTTTAILKNAM